MRWTFILFCNCVRSLPFNVEFGFHAIYLVCVHTVNSDTECIAHCFMSWLQGKFHFLIMGIDAILFELFVVIFWILFLLPTNSPNEQGVESQSFPNLRCSQFRSSVSHGRTYTYRLQIELWLHFINSHTRHNNCFERRHIIYVSQFQNFIVLLYLNVSSTPTSGYQAIRKF